MEVHNQESKSATPNKRRQYYRPKAKTTNQPEQSEIGKEVPIDPNKSISLTNSAKRRKRKKKIVSSDSSNLICSKDLLVSNIGMKSVPTIMPNTTKESIEGADAGRRISKQKLQDASRNLGKSPSPTKVSPSTSKSKSAIEPQCFVQSVCNSDPTLVTKHKSIEESFAEKDLKKHTKEAIRNNTKSSASPKVSLGIQLNNITASSISNDTKMDTASDKSREEVIAARELKKQAKLAAKKKNEKTSAIMEQPDNLPPEKITVLPNSLFQLLETTKITPSNLASPAQKQVPSKAERRAIQEAQRAAKQTKVNPVKSANAASQITGTDSAKHIRNKSSTTDQSLPTLSTTKKLAPAIGRSLLHRVKLFNHLYTDRDLPDNILNAINIHPLVIKLGAQYANRTVVGSNARCIAFMNTMKMVIEEYETPPQKEFSRGLETTIQPCVAYLHQCRPLSVSIANALKFIKWQLTQLPTEGETDTELKTRLLESMDTYIRDQVEKAAQAISISVQQKISNGDVILTFGCSSLINHILDEARTRKVDFRVVVVDARPDHEGQEMLRRLVALGIRCTCVLINAVGFIMSEVTKVLLGAHALMANGYVMSRAGTAQIALVAKAYNVPVLVCCETHKFSERVQTDAFVYNEIGNPTDLVVKSTKNSKQSDPISNWQSFPHLTPLNLCYDITPPELVTAVVTELAILPCTSVPVILRIQPS